jgi:hypothetical protein
VDACQLLRELGAGFVERRGRPTREDDQVAWDLVVATPKRALELRGAGAGTGGGVRIVIVGKETRTLLSMLKRTGVEFLVRRPFHPLVFRLLLLHALYRGPEKRRRERVAVGAPVQFRAGLRRRNAILADLSLRGCRLLSSYGAKRDQGVRVLLPAQLVGEKALKLSGKIVRTGPASGEESGTQAIAVAFEPMERAVGKQLLAILARFARGPAALPDSAAQGVAATSGPATSRTAGSRVRPAAPEQSEAAGSDAPPAEPPQPPEEPAADRAGDRRSEPRREYSKTVIALGEEAARVLIGRDISLRGMRVDPSPELVVGNELRIALHVRARSEPLVVDARVERDDGEAGVLLGFRELSDSAREYLDKMVSFLPILASRSPDGDEQGVVVSQILEQRDAGAPTPSS